MKIVYMSGCWDLFHIGHLNALKRARELGDVLVAGVATDEFVRLIKPCPIFPFEHRCAIIENLKCVDLVTPHKGFYDIDWLEEYGVDIRAIGPYHGEHREQRECLELIKKRGVDVVIIPRTPSVSSTWIKEVCCEEIRCASACPCGTGSGGGGSRAPVSSGS